MRIRRNLQGMDGAEPSATDVSSLSSRRTKKPLIALPYRSRDDLKKGLHFFPSQVQGVVSSDAFSTLVSKGRRPLRVCFGTPRYAKESKQILERIDHELSLKVGGITADPKFSSGMDR
jgi:hypothetical protein